MAGRKRTGPPKDKLLTPAAMFGQHLEQLVNASGLTVEEFAKKIGKSDEAVWLYFRGISTPRLNDWPTLAKVLKLSNLKDLLPDIKM